MGEKVTLKKLSDITKTDDNFVYGILGYADQNETDRSCLLKYSDRRLELIIPFEDGSSEVAQWFLSPQNYFPQLELDSEIPDQIWVRDIASRKIFILLNPRVIKSSATHNYLGSLGYGVVSSRYVIVGNSKVDYRKINEMKTSYPELLEWTHLGSIVSKFQITPDNTCESFFAGYEDKNEISITFNGIKCVLQSDPSAVEKSDFQNRFILENNVSFKTISDNALDMYLHEKIHRALNSLICILQWRSVGFDSVKVRNYTDYQIKSPGEKTTPCFRDVLSESFLDWEKPKKQQRNAFSLPDIKEEGLEKWFALCDECKRAISSLSYLASNHRYLTLDTQINEISHIFVEIAYCLGKRESKDNSGESFYKQVNIVLSATEKSYGELPIANKEDFINDLKNTYNSVKHTEASRNKKDRNEWLDPYREYQLVNASRALLVIWIAQELGASKESVYRDVESENAVINAFDRWR